MSSGNLDYIQEKTFFPKLRKSEEILEIRKNWNSRFQNFEKINLIILPNRSNRSNCKKSLNRLDRFIGQRINNCGSAFEPGGSGLPYYCTPPVCVSAVLDALAVWRLQTKTKKIVGSAQGCKNRGWPRTGRFPIFSIGWQWIYLYWDHWVPYFSLI